MITMERKYHIVLDLCLVFCLCEAFSSFNELAESTRHHSYPRAKLKKKQNEYRVTPVVCSGQEAYYQSPAACEETHFHVHNHLHLKMAAKDSSASDEYKATSSDELKPNGKHRWAKSKLDERPSQSRDQQSDEYAGILEQINYLLTNTQIGKSMCEKVSSSSTQQSVKKSPDTDKIKTTAGDKSYGGGDNFVEDVSEDSKDQETVTFTEPARDNASNGLDTSSSQAVEPGLLRVKSNATNNDHSSVELGGSSDSEPDMFDALNEYLSVLNDKPKLKDE